MQNNIVVIEDAIVGWVNYEERYAKKQFLDIQGSTLFSYTMVYIVDHNIMQ